MSETPTGPGWYDDPDDPQLLRYFDGIVWTSHTNPRRSPTAEQSTIGRAVQPQPPVTGGGAAGGPAAGSGGSSGWTPPGGRAPAGGNAPQGWGSASPYGGPMGARTDVLPDGAVLAEWWRRLLARILDSVIASALGVIVAIPWLGDALGVLDRYVDEAANAARGGAQPDAGAFVTDFTEAILPLAVVSLVVTLVYEVAFLTWKSATPGKMLLGTVVRRVGDGEPVGLVTALRRQVVSLLASAMSFVPLLGVAATVLNVIDPAWLLWDPKRQTLHDKVADTVVVLKG
ncbi:RDD family protein [Oryzobacter sp. R7]|uniref:RDD family protein n=1 Tax=Oryzobacter faecalis TaxID=3388656 RepID=UPI00398D2E92